MNNAGKLKIVALVLITVLITFICTSAYITNLIKVDNENGEETSLLNHFLTNDNTNSFSKLNEAYKLINKEYYTEVNKNELEIAAIQGLLLGLDDPYSYYMTKEEAEDFNADTLGNFSGIGLYLKWNTELNVIEVISAIKGTPAFIKGIQTGDYVIAVNGTAYKGEELNKAVSNIRGEKGTEVTLTIVRGNKTFDEVITRAEIDVNQIEYKMLDNKIGYIDIIQFDDNVSKDFLNAYNDLAKQGMKALIIDVRDNPGGLLSEVVHIVDMLLPKGLIVYTVEKDGTREDFVSDAITILDIPLVVLTDESSASASEILAGAIKDHGVGTIVGVKTYGKGLVQQLFSFSDGACIKLTVSEYFSPNGNKINGNGVIPDIIVEQNNNTKSDEQLDKAIEILK